MNHKYFNRGRRRTLKALGAAGSVAALPAWVVNAQASSSSNVESDAIKPTSNLAISFSDSYHAGAQLISLSNNGHKDMTMHHIYPGIVSTAGKTYDLNELMTDGNITIPAGRTQVYRINPVDPSRTEKSTTGRRPNGQSIQVSTIERSFNKAHAVNTTRYCLV